MTPLMHCEHCTYFDCACHEPPQEEAKKINVASGEDVVLEEEVS